MSEVEGAVEEEVGALERFAPEEVAVVVQTSLADLLQQCSARVSTAQPGCLLALAVSATTIMSSVTQLGMGEAVAPTVPDAFATTLPAVMRHSDTAQESIGRLLCVSKRVRRVSMCSLAWHGPVVWTAAKPDEKKVSSAELETTHFVGQMSALGESVRTLFVPRA